jgi:penicillin amidase
MTATFSEAVQQLEEKLGPDMEKWNYGQAGYKHATMEHLLSGFVHPELRDSLNVGPYPRGGNSYSPNSTGNTDNQLSGASFKFITDVGDWDNAWMINTPGQSGNPEDPYYKNIAELWAGNGYFPAYYSRAKIERATAKITELLPE